MDGPVAKMLPPGSKWESLFADAVNGAAELLHSTLGDPESSDWSWGSNHRTAPTHPLARLDPSLAQMLNPPSVPAGGGFDTPNAASYSTSGAFLNGAATDLFIGSEYCDCLTFLDLSWTYPQSMRCVVDDQAPRQLWMASKNAYHIMSLV